VDETRRRSRAAVAAIMAAGALTGCGSSSSTSSIGSTAAATTPSVSSTPPSTSAGGSGSGATAAITAAVRAYIVGSPQAECAAESTRLFDATYGKSKPTPMAACVRFEAQAAQVTKQAGETTTLGRVAVGPVSGGTATATYVVTIANVGSTTDHTQMVDQGGQWKVDS
jgi:hypothetical protein